MAQAKTTAVTTAPAKRIGMFETIGRAINAVGHTVAMGEEIAIAGHCFTAGLPQLAHSSSELLNMQASQALAEQRTLMEAQANS